APGGPVAHELGGLLRPAAPESRPLILARPDGHHVLRGAGRVQRVSVHNSVTRVVDTLVARRDDEQVVLVLPQEVIDRRILGRVAPVLAAPRAGPAAEAPVVD